MSNPTFPFSIPVEIYLGAATSFTTARAQWASSIGSNAEVYELIVLDQDTGVNQAGLYVFHNNRWNIAIPYDNINDFVISGGSVALYLDLTASATPLQGATVYRNGVESSATTLTPDPVIWATIFTNPTTGAVAGVATFNGRKGAVTLTTADVAAAMPIATSTALGGVKQGANITIASDGTISASINAGDIPAATATTLGGVIVPAANALTVDGTGKIGLNLGAGLSIVSSALTAAVASVVGTAKQITATASNGTITLSTPQNIDATATPTFGGLTTTGAATITGSVTVANSGAGNGVTITSAATGAGPVLSTAGSDANVDLNVTPKGTGAIKLNTNTTVTGTLSNTQSGGNGVTITPAANGSVPTISSAGANANVSLNINTQGAGGINLNAATTVTGNVAVTGAVNVQGAVSSAANTNPASVTNSGVSVNAVAPNGAGIDMYDSSQTANNRTGSILFYQGALRLRFYNDAHGTALEPLVITGGQATGTTSIALSTATSGLTLGPSGAITSSSPSNSWSHTGNFTVQSGAISSSAGAGIASATNSGVNLNYGGTYGMVSMYDSTRTANNRSADWLFINGVAQLRFANDGYTAFATALAITGGQASGVVSIAATTANTSLTVGNNTITSNSGTGDWTHTGTFKTTGVVTLSSGFTVASLPAASPALKGARAFVTDASDSTAPVWNATVLGGGANTVSVFCNGNAWVYG